MTGPPQSSGSPPDLQQLLSELAALQAKVAELAAAAQQAATQQAAADQAAAQPVAAPPAAQHDAPPPPVVADSTPPAVSADPSTVCEPPAFDVPSRPDLAPTTFSLSAALGALAAAARKKTDFVLRDFPPPPPVPPAEPPAGLAGDRAPLDEPETEAHGGQPAAAPCVGRQPAPAARESPADAELAASAPTRLDHRRPSARRSSKTTTGPAAESAPRGRGAPAGAREAAAAAGAFLSQRVASPAVPSPPPPPDLPPPDADSPSPLEWIRQARVYQYGSFSLSLVVHLAILLGMAVSMLPAMLSSQVPTLLAVQEVSDDALVELLEERPTLHDAVVVASAHSTLATGHVSALAGADEPTFDRQLVNDQGVRVNVGDLAVSSVPRGQLAMETPDEAPGDPHAIVDGYDEAMDRITHEILMMLQKSKVLVIWAFDQSESMKDDQAEIRARVEKVYRELQLHGATQGDALLTAVASFGATVRLHTEKPTADPDRIRAAIDEVPIDKTGQEMLCHAVGYLTRQFESAGTSGRRQVALILVTDESGDKQTNVDLLEAAIEQVRDARCRIYVLGREAVFGYLYAHIFWRHPQTGVIHKIPIDRGPETAYAEQLQTNGLTRRYDSQPSGFGPYEQCRMVRQTGGVFFMLPSVETDIVREDGNALVRYQNGLISKEQYLQEVAEHRRFTLRALRPYMPSLDARRDYLAERQASPLRSTLWTVIETLNPYDPAKAKVIEMRLRFSGDPPTFAREVQTELAKAKLYFDFLNLADDELHKLQAAREKEIYPRWQANYDLMRAQVIAYRVRLHEYGAYLQEFIKNPKPLPLRKEHPNQQPGHFLVLAHWNVIHVPRTLTGERTRSDIARATELFQAVIARHPNTPWAERAELELKRGFGIELEEEYHHVGPPPKNPPPPPPLIPLPKL